MILFRIRMQIQLKIQSSESVSTHDTTPNLLTFLKIVRKNCLKNTENKD